MIDEVDRLKKKKNAKLLAIMARGEYDFGEISEHFSGR